MLHSPFHIPHISFTKSKSKPPQAVEKEYPSKSGGLHATIIVTSAVQGAKMHQ
jgi:hypothetical protein